MDKRNIKESNGILETKILFVLLLTGGQICNSQTKSDLKTVVIKEFNWTVTIPENFTPVKEGEWGKIIEKSIDFQGEDILNQEATVFTYQNNKFNKFDAVWQPYDAEVCGDYLELNAEANQVMHKMYESQIPNANFDSITKTQTISNLEFQRFDVEIDVPDVFNMKIIRFYRLFGNKQFNMYMTVIDEKIGEKMLEAFLQSEFE
ncbi:MAG: hypothetical protein AB8B59_04370 [Maribacter sp.]